MAFQVCHDVSRLIGVGRVAPRCARGVAWHSEQTRSAATGRYPSHTNRAGNNAVLKRSTSEVAPNVSPPALNHKFVETNPAILFADLLISVRLRRPQGKGLHGGTPILPLCRTRRCDAPVA